VSEPSDLQPARGEDTDTYLVARSQVEHAIEHAIHYLPSQGPIAVFVHHNTLHAFEHLPFEQGVIEGWKQYGAEPYLSEDRYREELSRGRITLEDLDEVLARDLGEKGEQCVLFSTTRIALRRMMLRYQVRSGPDEELRWFIAETDALKKFRSEVASQTADRMLKEVSDELSAGGVKRGELEQRTLQGLHRICIEGAQSVGEVFNDIQPVRRHRDILLQVHGVDCDVRVHEQLVRFLGCVTDQGFAQWVMPNRERSLFDLFQDYYGVTRAFHPKWLQLVASEIADDRQQGRSSMESIVHSLHLLGIREYGVEDFIESTLLSLPGWAGMLWQLESNAAWTPRPASRGTLIDYLAIRLILDIASLRGALAELPQLEDRPAVREGSLSMERLAQELRFHQRRGVRQTVEQRAFLLFQLAQLLGWTPMDLESLEGHQWQALMSEISSFSTMERRRIFHLAYERHYRVGVLDAISHQRQPKESSEIPLFQLVTCIDDREESFRRYLEELEPKVETFGAAGFFSVPMYFRSASDAHYIPLCPVVLKPQHFVDEIGQLSQQELQRRQAEARRVLGQASHRLHLGSRTLVAGVVTSLLGSVASLPMVARVLAPRLTSRLRDAIARVVRPNQATTLLIERIDGDVAGGGAGGGAGRAPEGNLNRGFTHEEMANIVERLLGDLGLHRFSKIVFIVGHGSSSLNNPHESAYNCGACGGGRGGPNARAFALMANDYRVRRILDARGVEIPESTVFVGAYHNTCSDHMEYFDIDRLPPSHHMEFLEAKELIDRARSANALERARRFTSAPLAMDPHEALRHVEARAEDLAQARPEYNHATNAVCFVGRRIRTRGLFMDRRSFLTSYDPTRDKPDVPVLTRILQAVIPVCSGISLEYYFSTVDNQRYGCGSKLPHNITSLLGVMEGAASDLRTGLSQQMVEIHEPMRILFVIEQLPEKVLGILEKNPGLDRLVRNGWVQLATLSPQTQEISLYEAGCFVPYRSGAEPTPCYVSSHDYFGMHREHLPLVQIAQIGGAK
jgi:uncharacterized protein YbcC (UPF0753/DUF2309 family)